MGAWLYRHFHEKVLHFSGACYFSLTIPVNITSISQWGGPTLIQEFFHFHGIEMEHFFFFSVFDNRNGTLLFAGIGRSEMDLVKVVFNSRLSKDTLTVGISGSLVWFFHFDIWVGFRFRNKTELVETIMYVYFKTYVII